MMHESLIQTGVFVNILKAFLSKEILTLNSRAPLPGLNRFGEGGGGR